MRHAFKHYSRPCPAHESMSLASRVWYGAGPAARASRVTLLPASWLYGTVMRLRAWSFRHLPGGIAQSPLPALSIGNLSVGGTGKTPIAAWAAARLREAGASPAIVMRGYGGDEPLVHARLNPGIAVISATDRISGAAQARDHGADCVILDDAFQHQRISRVADWVLVAAEQWTDHLRVLPAGPLREPLGALRRASLIIVTRKSASTSDAERVEASLAERAAEVPVARIHLAAGPIVEALTEQPLPAETLTGRRVLAVAAIGNPDSFFAQLRELGAHVTERAFSDHHAFDALDVRTLASEARAYDAVVCTLKDAVKLAPQWTPAFSPLWYVSQHAMIESGKGVLDRALATILAARRVVETTAGPPA